MPSLFTHSIPIYLSSSSLSIIPAAISTSLNCWKWTFESLCSVTPSWWLTPACGQSRNVMSFYFFYLFFSVRNDCRPISVCSTLCKLSTSAPQTCSRAGRSGISFWVQMGSYNSSPLRRWIWSLLEVWILAVLTVSTMSTSYSPPPLPTCFFLSAALINKSSGACRASSLGIYQETWEYISSHGQS